MSWSTSELRVRLAPLNRFKPSSKIFYWPFQGGTSFVDLLCFCSVLCLLCFVRVCLYVLRGHLLGKGWPLGSRLWCLLWVCHFPIGILGQVWYLIVSIPDLCNLTYLGVESKDQSSENIKYLEQFYIYYTKHWILTQNMLRRFLRCSSGLALGPGLRRLKKCKWEGWGLMLCVWSGPLGLNCWISIAPVFSCMYCWVLIFVLSPFYILICLYLEMMHQ